MGNYFRYIVHENYILHKTKFHFCRSEDGTFSYWVSSSLLQQKSPTAEIIAIYFLGIIVLRKYMPIISAVGLFCYDEFEETPNEKVVIMAKFTKPYFSIMPELV